MCSSFTALRFSPVGRGFAIVGGSWNNTSNAGLFALNLNNAVSNSNTNIGGSYSSISKFLSFIKLLNVFQAFAKVSHCVFNWRYIARTRG